MSSWENFAQTSALNQKVTVSFIEFLQDVTQVDIGLADVLKVRCACTTMVKQFSADSTNNSFNEL